MKKNISSSELKEQVCTGILDSYLNQCSICPYFAGGKYYKGWFSCDKLSEKSFRQKDWTELADKLIKEGCSGYNDARYRASVYKLNRQ